MINTINIIFTINTNIIFTINTNIIFTINTNIIFTINANININIISISYHQNLSNHTLYTSYSSYIHLYPYIASITSTYHHRYYNRCYHTCVADRVTEAKTAGVGDKDNKSVDDVGESRTLPVTLPVLLGMELVLKLVLGLGLGLELAVTVALTVVAVVEVLNVGERV